MSNSQWPWIQPTATIQPGSSLCTPVGPESSGPQPTPSQQVSVATLATAQAINTSHLPPLPTPPSTQPFTAQTDTAEKKKKKTGRSGSPNYSDDDIDHLLDIAEDVEPLGSNQWALVADKFNDWAAQNERPNRDMDSLKSKFDKLANMKKPTGDPSCPPQVRRAKHIARGILGRCNAMSVGDDSSSDGDDKEGFGDSAGSLTNTDQAESVSAGRTEKRRASTAALGARKNKRTSGATVVRVSKEEDQMLIYVGSMSQSIEKISQSIIGSGGSQETIGRDEITKIVKDEIKSELEVTNSSIDELKGMMKAFVDSLNQK